MSLETGKTQKHTLLSELAVLFLRLGSTSFGGPAVHIAMMEDEVVRRRHWLTPQQFLDMVAATNVIPGPNSTELAIHIGFHRAGLKGLLVAGIAFITPAVLIVSLIAWLYVQYGNLPLSGAFLYGIKPVVLTVVIQALWRLGQSALKSRFLIAVAALAVCSNLSGLGELPVLFLAALAAALAPPLMRSKSHTLHSLIGCWGSLLLKPTLMVTPALAGAAKLAVSLKLWQVFLVFLKIGAVLFGSGYVLLAFLRAELVEKLGLLTETQLLDAISIGQFTPGPVFTTATFIGYILSGPAGALAATVGIFLPAFFFVAVSAPFLPYLRGATLLARILDGLNAASLALMGAATLQLAHAAVFDWTTALVMAISGVSLHIWKINSTGLVITGGIVGVASNLFH